MNIFNIPIKDINKVINQALAKSTPEEVLQELIKCGYERRVYKMDNDENKDYNIPKYIDDFAESIEGGWWNYRLIEKESKWTDKNNKEHIDTYYEIHEVYYNGKGEIWSWSENPMSLYFESKYDVKECLKQIKQASKHNILKLEKHIDPEDNKEYDRLIDTKKKIKDIK